MFPSVLPPPLKAVVGSTFPSVLSWSIVYATCSLGNDEVIVCHFDCPICQLPVARIACLPWSSCSAPHGQLLRYKRSLADSASGFLVPTSSLRILPLCCRNISVAHSSWCWRSRSASPRPSSSISTQPCSISSIVTPSCVYQQDEAFVEVWES